jgi:hypothetical protein
MSYYRADAASYEGRPLIGDGQCAVLVEELSGAPRTSHWRRGQKVRGASIRTGTAIATFNSAGKYPNLSTGNHAALYLSQDKLGIWVIEQYVGLEKIQKRPIRFMNGKTPYHGNIANDGDAYSVIE